MFINRVDAGTKLAEALESYRGRDVVVFGLPRGGVPVAAEVARVLGAPLDIIGVRKLGAPGQPELAIGAIGEGGVRIINYPLVDSLGVTKAQIARVEAAEQEELTRRMTLYRSGAPEASVVNRIAIVVDDGLATGATAKVACLVARAKGASEVILAVPVAPEGEAERFEGADRVVVLETPEPFWGVGSHYRDFGQTSNDEVIALLAQSDVGGEGQK